MKIRTIVFFIGVILLAGCASYEAQQIKLLQEGLQPMLGRNETEVLALVTKTWGYGVLDHWEAENPKVDFVLKKNFRSFGFSRSEAETLFAEPGAYKVLILTRPLRREELTTGQIDSMGGGIIGTSERNVSTTHGYIRLVIKDGKLAAYWAGT